jgi:O6-methylguanine-DNA--protein-cysteine methyltransferase
LQRPIDLFERRAYIQGTAFQARVWRALQKIPLGKTASYTEIAASLGQPKAVARSLRPAPRTSSPCSCRAIG